MGLLLKTYDVSVWLLSGYNYPQTRLVTFKYLRRKVKSAFSQSFLDLTFDRKFWIWLIQWLRKKRVLPDYVLTLKEGKLWHSKFLSILKTLKLLEYNLRWSYAYFFKEIIVALMVVIGCACLCVYLLNRSIYMAWIRTKRKKIGRYLYVRCQER